mgnify:CR=1 FL=1
MSIMDKGTASFLTKQQIAHPLNQRDTNSVKKIITKSPIIDTTIFN